MKYIHKIIYGSCVKNLALTIITLMMLLMLNSCKKFVEVDLPITQITGPVVFQDVATANAAVTDIYSKLRSANNILTGDYTGLSNLLGQYSDEIVLNTNAGGVSEEPEFYQNNLIPSTPRIGTFWNNSYNLIYAANAILEGLEQSTSISDMDKNRLKGEALFIRAYIHFYLVNLYGNIPYVNTTDYRVNTTISKMTSDAVYAAIIADLNQAKILLPDTYANAERVRPIRGVASALLARVYLYTQNWAAAETEATAVIESSLYTWVGNIDDVFLKGSTGTLWQLMTTNAGSDATLEAYTFIISNNREIPNRVLNDVLLNAFEMGDLRKTHWITPNINGTFYLPYKYKKITNTSISTEYSIQFRLEEQYLIRAEAKANLNNISGAVADLNKIRTRARALPTLAVPNPLPDYLPTISKDDCLTAILHERQVELFTELGHRFFDLKRTGKANAALTGVKPNWNPTDILWPLPEKELLLNPNLKPQNAGY